MGWLKKIDYKANAKAVFERTTLLYLFDMKNVLKKGGQYTSSVENNLFSSQIKSGMGKGSCSSFPRGAFYVSKELL